MVDVGDKPVTRRRAVAEAIVRVSAKTRRAIARGGLPKGDFEPVARLAAIQGAKEAAHRVPLAHPIPLTHVSAHVAPTRGGYRVEVAVSAEAKTGVEIEALSGALSGALALYDMIKGLERGAEIASARLLFKEGGRSGRYGRR